MIARSSPTSNNCASHVKILQAIEGCTNDGKRAHDRHRSVSDTSRFPYWSFPRDPPNACVLREQVTPQDRCCEHSWSAPPPVAWVPPAQTPLVRFLAVLACAPYATSHRSLSCSSCLNDVLKSRQSRTCKPVNKCISHNKITGVLTVQQEKQHIVREGPPTVYLCITCIVHITTTSDTVTFAVTKSFENIYRNGEGVQLFPKENQKRVYICPRVP